MIFSKPNRNLPQMEMHKIISNRNIFQIESNCNLLISWESLNQKYQDFHKPTLKYGRQKYILKPNHFHNLPLFQNIQIYSLRSLNRLPHFPRKSQISFHTKFRSYLEDYTPLGKGLPIFYRSNKFSITQSTKDENCQI